MPEIKYSTVQNWYHKQKRKCRVGFSICDKENVKNAKFPGHKSAWICAEIIHSKE
jgi:hypothetical protein